MPRTTVPSDDMLKIRDQPAGLGKAALKRRRIIKAAALVFGRRGYAQTTMTEIATEAGTQAGSLYYYFDSREQLVEEVLMESSRLLSERVTAALDELPPSADAFERFTVMVRTHVLNVLERDDFSIAYQKIHDQITDEMRENVARVPRAYARYWTAVFEDAVKQGFLRSDLDARLTRMLLIGSIQWMGDWYKRDGPASPDEIADAVVRLFLEGAANDREEVQKRLGAPKRPRRARRKSKDTAG